MRKQTPVPDKKEKDVSRLELSAAVFVTMVFLVFAQTLVSCFLQPFEVDLSSLYLAYTEESMRQSLMKQERPRTSKSSKSGRPKTGRR